MGLSGIEVVKPLCRSDDDVLSFLDQNEEWILGQLERVERLRKIRVTEQLAGEILFRGERTRVRRMSLRRGFKAEANRISLRLRTSLGLAAHAPINLAALANELAIRLVTLSSFKDECPEAVHYLTRKEPSTFSAATVPLPDSRHVIVFNDSHSKARSQSSSRNRPHRVGP